MLDELSKIREVALIYDENGLGTKKNRLNLSKLSPSQKKIADCLEIAACLAG